MKLFFGLTAIHVGNGQESTVAARKTMPNLPEIGFTISC